MWRRKIVIRVTLFVFFFGELSLNRISYSWAQKPSQIEFSVYLIEVRTFLLISNMIHATPWVKSSSSLGSRSLSPLTDLISFDAARTLLTIWCCRAMWIYTRMGKRKKCSLLNFMLPSGVYSLRNRILYSYVDILASALPRHCSEHSTQLSA